MDSAEVQEIIKVHEKASSAFRERHNITLVLEDLFEDNNNNFKENDKKKSTNSYITILRIKKEEHFLEEM